MRKRETLEEAKKYLIDYYSKEEIVNILLEVCDYLKTLHISEYDSQGYYIEDKYKNVIGIEEIREMIHDASLAEISDLNVTDLIIGCVDRINMED